MGAHKNKPEVEMKRAALLPVFSIFTSAGTLLCCALPALLVSLGAGAMLAGLVSAAPWITVLSTHKVWTFAIAGILLLVAGFFLWRGRNLPCPADKELARSCAFWRRFSLWVYGISVAMFAIGFFFAFVAVHLFY